ncbi:MAG: PEP-CTERM sorting domain-containing protein [Akkermansiaceae bacterium]
MKHTSSSLLIIALAVSCHASSISVNFNISGNDNNAVNNDETATSIAAGANWNNINLGTAEGSVGIAFDGTSLVDDTNANAATLNTTIGAGAGFIEWHDVTTGAARGTQGEAGLMQSSLNFGGAVPAETLTVNGLGGDFIADGYSVYLYFEFNATSARTYGFTIDDGSTASTYWTNDGIGEVSDPDDDGLMTWTQATGTTSGTATVNGNYMVHTGMSGSSFTITGVTTSGRAVLSGFQVVSNPVPEPSSAALLGLGGLALIQRRRKQSII